VTGDRADGISIRSYRVVFDLERRIHKVDRIRLPFPYGLPLRSVAYGVAVLAVTLVLTRLPVVGAVLASVPLPVRVAVLPAIGAYVLTQLRPDGRSAHRFLLAWARQRLGPRRYVAFAAARACTLERLADVVVGADERGAVLRAAVVEGPAIALLRQPVHACARGRTLAIEQTSDEPLFQGRRLTVQPGQRAVLR
jgi:hypothetical protein